MEPEKRERPRDSRGRRAHVLGLRVSVGAKGQTRTADRTIFSRELYQLSYLGAGRGPVRWAIEGSNL